MFSICMVGTGYVGLVSGACLADFGNRVVCVDIDEARIASISAGVMPIYEPGLKDLVDRNRAAGRLLFTSDLASAVRESAIVFSAVGTPQREDGSCDLDAVFRVAGDVARHAERDTVFVQKSTVPVGTSERVGKILGEHARPGVRFERVSNPEFLREGSAIEDFMRPNRVVIGVEGDRAREVMREIYRPLYLLETPIVFTTIRTAELIKYASNAFLATKISFINEIAELCEAVGADVDMVARAMGLDRRIGPKFLHAGIGYGGSCLPKDVAAIIHTAAEAGAPLRIIRAVDEVNRSLVERLIDKMRGEIPSFAGTSIAVLGLSFKPNTDDVREAPALRLIERLLAAGAAIGAYDPAAIENARRIFGDRLRYHANAYDATAGADALVIATEWNELRVLDLDRIKRLLRRPLIFDCRNIYQPGEMAQRGFRYHSFGRAAARAGATPQEA